MTWPRVRYLWDYLRSATIPVVLYGMGDGADKALAQCEEHGVPIAGVFASPGFVRGQSFRGFQVETLEQLESRLQDFIVLQCFATQRPEVLDYIRQVGERHTLLVPDLPVWGQGILTPELCARHSDDIERLHDLLEDEDSRKVLHHLIAYKLSGDPAWLWRCETPRSEAYTAILRPGGEECFVDAGAYTGDTADEFLQHTDGRYSAILALEPDKRNYRKLCARLEHFRNTSCLQVAVWSHREQLPFSHSSGRQASLEGGNDLVQADSIDNLLGGRPASLINFDIEGAEQQGLLGCRRTIDRYKPKLAVSVYHRNLDFFQLPLLIHQLQPEYRLYLRHHPYLPAWDTLCYAI